MNNKQQLFLNEYLKTWNATKAAKAAGYSEHSAYSTGQRLLKDDEIQAAIKERMEDAAMSANEVLFHLASIARGDMDDLVDANGNLDLDKARELGKTNLIKRVRNKVFSTDKTEISEMETESYDRLKALELLGKFWKIFTDKSEVENSGEITIKYVNDWRGSIDEDDSEHHTPA